MRAGAEKSHERAEWLAAPERGSMCLLRLMAIASLRLGRTLSRVALYPIAAYFFLFAPRARRHSRRYLRLALGRRPTTRDRFRHLLYFASTIHDRVYWSHAREDLFQISVEGAAPMRARAAAGEGALLLGAHLGSFEAVGSIGRQVPGLRILMAMYEENARKISGTMSAINPAVAADIIPLGRVDAMLAISERLREGYFVGVLGDRTLAQEPMQAVTLLGERAYLPTGPMRLAAILGCSVMFMAGLYRGANRYHVLFAPLADFSRVDRAGRDAAVAAAIDRYAALLDSCCRSDPYNWFNFYDFWRAGADRGDR